MKSLTRPPFKIWICSMALGTSAKPTFSESRQRRDRIRPSRRATPGDVVQIRRRRAERAPTRPASGVQAGAQRLDHALRRMAVAVRRCVGWQRCRPRHRARQLLRGRSRARSTRVDRLDPLGFRAASSPPAPEEEGLFCIPPESVTTPALAPRGEISSRYGTGRARAAPPSSSPNPRAVCPAKPADVPERRRVDPASSRRRRAPPSRAGSSLLSGRWIQSRRGSRRGRSRAGSSPAPPRRRASRTRAGHRS